MLDSLNEAVAASRTQSHGADARLLIAFDFADDISLDEIGTLPGVELVSQEAGRVALVFATPDALSTFEARLSSMSLGRAIKREALIFALDGVRAWGSVERTGRALAAEGPPSTQTFIVDVELWSSDQPRTRQTLEADFEQAFGERAILVLDRIALRSGKVYRFRVTHADLDWLLNYRDVRRVDLPPKWEVPRSELARLLEPLPRLTNPPDGSERVAVLDTGVLEGHPLIAPTLGDAQSFYSATALSATDDHGHGTFVAALAAYGDLHERIQVGLSCEVILLSGRVLDSKAEYIAGVDINQQYDARIIANDVRQAVAQFRNQYDCRIYCLSFGDLRHPYAGGHLDGLALAIDEIARESNCLFIVAAGNIPLNEIPRDPEAYPRYLFEDQNRILDPATALNALTVGSLARREATDWQMRYQSDVRELPIARRDQPSPFTRSGPSVFNAVKPDVVFYGGNCAINLTGGNSIVTRGLGEVSARLDFTGGQLLVEDCGTSAAAPVVAHLAARLLAITPERDAILARALIAAHSSIPPAAQRLFGVDTEKLLNSVGYGKPEFDRALRSSERVLTLYARDSIANKTHHFYELPVPEEFFTGERRTRRISVALSHFASTRSSRIEYKEERLSFKLVPGELDRVSATFNAATADEVYENIPEVTFKHSIGARRRSRGSLQACTWYLTQPREVGTNMILVITRNDRAWSLSENPENYGVAIVIDDRLNEEAALHTYARAQLRIPLRVQGRL